MTISELESKNPDYYFVDFDGCITHSVEAITKLLNKKFNKNVNPQDIVSWNFQCNYPKMTDKDVEDIFADKRFFDVVKFIDGAKEFLLSHENSIIVTKGTTENLYRKNIWLNENGLGMVKFIGLPLNVSKGIIDMTNSVFIDDSTYNLKESNARYKVQFCEYKDNIDREWQIGWKGCKMYEWK